MIILKKESDLAKMRECGKILAWTLRLVSEEIKPGVTPKQLDELADRLIMEKGGKPSFLGYRGYPAATCISVNNVVIHGIPDDTPLQEGDIIDLDFGVYKNGFHADSAWTFPVGKISKNAERLLNITQEAMWQGIAKAKVGAKVGEISSAVQKYVETNGYSVVRELVGHGIGRSLHEEPSVPNYGKPSSGALLRDGTTICIEPMVNEGTCELITLEDGWTMLTKDGKLSAHFEHTVAVTRDGPEVLTVE